MHVLNSAVGVTGVNGLLSKRLIDVHHTQTALKLVIFTSSLAAVDWYIKLGMSDGAGELQQTAPQPALLDSAARPRPWKKGATIVEKEHGERVDMYREGNSVAAGFGTISPCIIQVAIIS